MSRCPSCDEIIPEGCNCEVIDTACYEWTGDGSADDPFRLEPIFDPDGDNLASCSEDGLLAELTAATRNPPAAQAHRSTHLSVANNTLTAVNLNLEDYDTDTMHSTSVNTSRLTFTTTGLYCVTFVCAWDKHLTGNRLAFIRKNGTDILAQDSKKSGDSDPTIIGHCLTLTDEFTATDYVEGLVRQTSGVALLLLTESYSPFLSATKI